MVQLTPCLDRYLAARPLKALSRLVLKRMPKPQARCSELCRGSVEPERMVALSPLLQPEVAETETVVVVVVVVGDVPVVVVDEVAMEGGSGAYEGLVP